MWLSILSLLVGALPAVLSQLAAERQNYAAAQTEQARIASQERITALEAKRDVLIAEARTPWNTVVRASLVAPFCIYIWKLVVVDKIVCPYWYGASCSTDPLSDWLYGICAGILGFYFLKSK